MRRGGFSYSGRLAEFGRGMSSSPAGGAVLPPSTEEGRERTSASARSGGTWPGGLSPPPVVELFAPRKLCATGAARMDVIFAFKVLEVELSAKFDGFRIREIAEAVGLEEAGRDGGVLEDVLGLLKGEFREATLFVLELLAAEGFGLALLPIDDFVEVDGGADGRVDGGSGRLGVGGGFGVLAAAAHRAQDEREDEDGDEGDHNLVEEPRGKGAGGRLGVVLDGGHGIRPPEG